MQLTVLGRRVYAYTGGRPFDPALPAVVFLHGASNDHTVWGLQTRWFAHHGFTVLAPDLPGHQRSEGPPLASVEALADWVGALLEAAGLGGAALVGHSMGSLVALESAARLPGRVSRIALVGTAVPMPVSEALLDAARQAEPAAIDMVVGWSHSPRARFGANPVPGLWMPGSATRLMQRMAPGVLANDLSACNAYAGGLEAAARVRCPVLIVAGSADLMTPPRATTELIAALADCRRVTLPGAGHSLMAEQPDGVLDALRGFISA